MNGFPADSGLPGYDAINWYPLMAPAATPRDIITKLNAEILKALHDANVRERLIAQGLIPAGGSPEQLGQFIREDTKRWEPVIAATGVKLD